VTVEEVRNPFVELALDATGGEFGEQGGMPDSIESMIYVSREAQISCRTLRASIHCWMSRSTISNVE